MKKTVFILAPYPLHVAPSQRFRFEHFLNKFSEHNLEYSFQSFWSEKAWGILYQEGKTLSKARYLLFGFLRRFAVLFRLLNIDYVYVHRELTPIGPPVFEWLIARVLNKKIIYDFDDAIWLNNTSKANKIVAGIKYHGKIKRICKWSWKITVGNAFLQEYAGLHNPNVFVVPTLVDTNLHHNRIKIHEDKKLLTIGWTGTHSTSVYLKMLEKPLSSLQRDFDFEFLVISNQPPNLNLKNLKYLKWNKEQEIDQLLNFDIGVMPMENSLWEKGKCGFKIIQYLALGIPAVASPVGVNTEIIEHNKNGFLAANQEDWARYLKRLLADTALRSETGARGRKEIVDHYSVAANRELFFSVFT